MIQKYECVIICDLMQISQLNSIKTKKKQQKTKTSLSQKYFQKEEIKRKGKLKSGKIEENRIKSVLTVC